MRLPILDAGEMTPEQIAARAATVAGKRGHSPPPVEMWLYSPELANRAQRVGEFIRFGTCLPPPLLEMAILVTGRFWGSHYEWYAHRKLALAAGLDPAIIDAIRDRREPVLTDPAARAVYAYAGTLLREHAVPQAMHDAVVAAFGTRGVVELVATCGYYSMVAMTLNAFEVPLPDGEVSELG